ncbi:hypothetical protein L5515_010336 [Caenorhabditis briggsae]|nr:hypothetical protein L5515_010336 [Caenorhabditis briggsae]
MPTPSPVLPSERVFSNSHRAQELPLSTPSPAASKIPAPFEVLTVNKPGPDNKAPEVSCDVESLATSPGKVKTTEPIKLDQKEDSATEKKRPEESIIQIDEARRKQLNADRISNFAPFFKTTFLPFSMSTIYTAWSSQEVQEFLCQFLKPAAMETLKNLKGPDLEKIRFDNRAFFNQLRKNGDGLSWLEYLSIEGQINEIKSYNHKMAMFRASM